MVAEALAKSIGIPIEQVEHFLKMPYAQLYSSVEYYDLVKLLNYDALAENLPEVRRVYDQYLPGLIDHLRDRHGYMGKPMTAFTLGNWLIGFLNQPHLLFKLVEIHNHIPPQVVASSLPAILDMLGKMEKGGPEWQQATAVLALPFFAQGQV